MSSSLLTATPVSRLPHDGRDTGVVNSAAFTFIEVVIFTVLITIVALLYNVVSSLVGGIHVTLGDD